MKKINTRPKRQQPSMKNLRTTPQYQQFVTYCIEIGRLMEDGGEDRFNSKFCEGAKYGLLSHLAYLSFGKPIQKGKEEQQMQTATHRTENQTNIIQGDEDSEYLSYMKQYETVIKNSRRKDYVSVQPKQQMDELISQFLSDIQGSNGKTSRYSQTDNTPKVIPEVAIQSEVPVKVQKIDLNARKSNGNSRVNTKRSTGTATKKEETPIKHINIDLSSKKQELSPRFGSTHDKKIPSSSPKINYKTKNGEKVQITVMKTDKCQQKKEIKQPVVNKQQKTQSVKQAIKAQPKQDETRSQIKQAGYSHHSRNTQTFSESYLKQNIHKTSRHTLRHQKPELREIEVSQRSPNSSLQKRKPIKIEIDIPIQQFSQSEIQRVQNYEVESTIGLRGQQTEIIREVTERVLCLLQKTKQVGKHPKH